MGLFWNAAQLLSSEETHLSLIFQLCPAVGSSELIGHLPNDPAFHSLKNL